MLHFRNWQGVMTEAPPDFETVVACSGDQKTVVVSQCPKTELFHVRYALNVNQYSTLGGALGAFGECMAHALDCGELPGGGPLNSVWRASIESKHFVFECIAWTESEARASVIAGLEAHAKAHKLDSQWVPDMSADIDTAQLSIGAAYRDGELISTKKE